MTTEFKSKAKTIVVSGALCAMGGYICGDKIDEYDKLQQEVRPYEAVNGMLNDARKREKNCSELQEECLIQKNSYKIQIDSLEWIIKQADQEFEIRENQIDSLESLAKNLYASLEIFKNRSPIENEFQAIHNCINAHGSDMSQYQYQLQVSCCIKIIKDLQNKYPNNDLKKLKLQCDD